MPSPLVIPLPSAARSAAPRAAHAASNRAEPEAGRGFAKALSQAQDRHSQSPTQRASAARETQRAAGNRGDSATAAASPVDAAGVPSTDPALAPAHEDSDDLLAQTPAAESATLLPQPEAPPPTAAAAQALVDQAAGQAGDAALNPAALGAALLTAGQMAPATPADAQHGQTVSQTARASRTDRIDLGLAGVDNAGTDAAASALTEGLAATPATAPVPAQRHGNSAAHASVPQQAFAAAIATAGAATPDAKNTPEPAIAQALASAGEDRLQTPTPALAALAAASPGARSESALPAALDKPLPFEAHIAAALDSPAFGPALGARLSLLARDGIQEARLQLNPADMGPISVQIAVNEGLAHVEFRADLAATRSALEASLPDLAAALRESGLTLSGGGVFEQSRQSAQAQGERPGSARGRASRAANGVSADDGTPSNSAARARPRGVVDLYA